MNNRGSRWLWAGAALLVLNSAYLSVARGPDLLHLWNLLLHPVLGIVLLLPFVRWWRRRRRPLVDLGAVLLAASAAAGLALVLLGNRSELRFLLWAHMGLAVVGLLVLVWGCATGSRGALWKISVAGIVLALSVPVLARILRAEAPPEVESGFVNPPAPMSLAERAQGGAGGPFYPAALSTRNGKLLPESTFDSSRSCGNSGCHPDIVAEWSSSAHRFSGFDNPWYRRSYDQMREERGEVASRWCAGCHAPALLATGSMERPSTENTPAVTQGVSCIACHGITEVKSTMGQADFELGVSPLHALATSSSGIARALHGLLLRIDPEPHRRTYSKPFQRSAEFCSTCHVAWVDPPLNDYRHLAVMNDYDLWQNYSASGQGISRSIHYPEPQSCIDCHMPAVASEDAGHQEGKVRSHRFASANTALPALRGDDAQLQAVVDSLRDGLATVDIFAMSKGKPQREAPERVRNPEIHAPLDRIPATLRRGESNRFDVMLRSHGIGHFFPAGKLVTNDVWLELRAVDDRGRTIFWSGRVDEQGDVDPGAHFISGLWVDRDGQRVEGYEVWNNVAAAYVQQIEPYASAVVRYRVDVPPDAGDQLTLTARLHHRKFSSRFTRWVFSDLETPVPELPIVTMAEDSITLQVVDADADLPDMENPSTLPEIDYERWYYYGYGLANRGDFRLGRRAIQTALELAPDYAEGWTTLGNLEWAVSNNSAAREALERALEIDPDQVRAHYYLGMAAMDDSDFDLAREHLSVVVSHYPRERQAWSDLGRALFLSAEYEQAAEAFNRSLAIDPRQTRVLFTQALAHRALGRVELSKKFHELYERFLDDPLAQEAAAAYLKTNPHANAERQALHEHYSIPLDDLAHQEPGL